MRDRPQHDDVARVVPPASSPQAPLPEPSRRRFLFALGVTSAGAAAASAAALAATAAPVTATAPADTGQSRGYQETDHVRNYYNTART